MVAVSKPCCPTCWDLMYILRGSEKDHFLVRSCHSMVYPVELPPWLPKDVCQEMVSRFHKHLVAQLQIMTVADTVSKAMDHKKEHCHLITDSVDSNSNLSIASDASDHSILTGDLWGPIDRFLGNLK
jgi:hypothetical protein